MYSFATGLKASGEAKKDKCHDDSWICRKMKHSLFVPNDELISICEACDKVFDNFHEDGLRVCDHPYDKLWKSVLKEHHVAELNDWHYLQNSDFNPTFLIV